MKNIGIVITYFGKFPEWTDLFFETLKQNPTIDFIFFTDCNTQAYHAPNLIFHNMHFKEYVALVNEKLPFPFQPQNGYKICDLRPLFGFIHKELLKPYDFYGWTDMDILFGDIRSFYTDDLLSKYDVFSASTLRITGHLALFKNNRYNRNIYKKIDHWKEALLNEAFVGIDENGLMHAYRTTIMDRLHKKYNLKTDNWFSRFLSKRKIRKLYLKNQYTTPFVHAPWIDGTIDSMQPDVWYYKNGIITNQRDKDRRFIYLHFMNFKSSRWRHDGTKAPWEEKERICFVTGEDMKTGIEINATGFVKA